MQRISRADDNVWVVGAFDPKKPYDPDWASKSPAPVLRSGDEPQVFGDSPLPHNHVGDAMNWDAAVPPDDEDGVWSRGGDEPLSWTPSSNGVSTDVPNYDLTSIMRHRISLQNRGTGLPAWGTLDGNDPRGPMVQNYEGSNVHHYYTYRPEHDPVAPWQLSTMHWELRDPIDSSHATFESAVARSVADKRRLKERGIY